MLRSLIAQLFSNQQCISKPLVSLFKSYQDGGKQPQTKDLEKLLEALIESYERTFIVLDALDECKNREELFEFIGKAMKWRSENLNIIMTSRENKDIEDFFDGNLDKRSRISVQNKKVDEDIRSYVHGTLQSDRKFKRWKKQPKVQGEIEIELMEKSRGM